MTHQSAGSLLYVEDVLIVAMVVTWALEEAGFQVRHELNGKCGVNALQDRPDAYHALVTDIRLPELDGWAMARQAREINPRIPVVYLTGDSAADWSTKRVADSVLLQKPFANSDLIAAIRRLIN